MHAQRAVADFDATGLVVDRDGRDRLTAAACSRWTWKTSTPCRGVRA